MAVSEPAGQASHSQIEASSVLSHLSMQRQTAEQAKAEALEALESVQYYSNIQVLGQGTFGVVARAMDTRTNPPMEVAVKLLRRGNFIRDFRTYVKREIVHQSSLRHPFIIGLREVTLLRKHLAIVMEFAEGGDLYKYVLKQRPVTRLHESIARWIFQQLIIGVDYCHQMGVANRDLKLENLLLDRDHNNRRPLLKICDFGYSKHELNSPATTGVGTPIYMAPEIIYGSSRYDAKQADIWSVGIILYTILYGRYPFNSNDPDYPRLVVNAQYNLPDDIQVSMSCKNLLKDLLVPDPHRRITMEGIKAHPWFLFELPDGALLMNDFYMRTVPNSIEQIAVQISDIVDQALHPAGNTERPTSVQLLGRR
ncbi:hypothetical protein WJX73_001401 [Symbiochloris irregularis]|uniref:non-specific serine/threonine protein kinase n=1 Tax=Symbiochloris irregularis TaxID=706552 RepID=A0AAW1PVR2_9CHLO